MQLYKYDLSLPLNNYNLYNNKTNNVAMYFSTFKYTLTSTQSYIEMYNYVNTLFVFHCGQIFIILLMRCILK